MAIKVKVNGQPKESSNFLINVRNKAKQVSQIYCKVNGVAKLVWENWKLMTGEYANFNYTKANEIAGLYESNSITRLSSPIKVQKIHINGMITIRDAWINGIPGTADLSVQGQKKDGNWVTLYSKHFRAPNNPVNYYTFPPYDITFESSDKETEFYAFKTVINSRSKTEYQYGYVTEWYQKGGNQPTKAMPRMMRMSTNKKENEEKEVEVIKI